MHNAFIKDSIFKLLLVKYTYKLILKTFIATKIYGLQINNLLVIISLLVF